MTQILTDRRALAQHRARADVFFLQAEAVAEVQERLSEVNRVFTAPVVVTASNGGNSSSPCTIDAWLGMSWSAIEVPHTKHSNCCKSNCSALNARTAVAVKLALL